MKILETYVHAIGLSITIILLIGYITYKYIKKEK